MAEIVNAITVRVIRSFEYRNIHNVVFRDVNLNQSASCFFSKVKEDVSAQKGLPPPVRKHAYDAMKIQHKAYGAKTSDPVINTEDDDRLLLKLNRTLKENGIENETEISLFNLEEYKRYKENPEKKWL